MAGAPAVDDSRAPSAVPLADLPLAAPEPEHTPARRPAWSVFLMVAAVVLLVDQLSKAWVVSTVQPGSAFSVLGDLLRVVYSKNSGALFGLFGSVAPVMALVSVGVLVVIVWYHGHAARSLVLSLALGMLLGGAIGNSLDRIRLGFVVDWVDMGVGSTRFWTYNLADAAVDGAILLLLLGTLRSGSNSSARDG